MVRVAGLITVLMAGCDSLFSIVSFGAADATVTSGDAPVLTVDADVNGVGCADGTREGFADLGAFPRLAACSGAWQTEGGLLAHRIGGAACSNAGNHGSSPDGDGCAAADLCAPGWAICATAGDVGGRLGTAASCDTPIITEGFFATAQPSNGATSCALPGTNDLYGCGSLGLKPALDCLPLTHYSGDGCVELGHGWQCVDHTTEQTSVKKYGSDFGGVLCCRSPI